MCSHPERNLLAIHGSEHELRAVNILRIALVCVAALSVCVAVVSHDSGRRHSPKALELERVTSFLVQVLRRTDESPGQVQRKIAERFSNQQIYQLAMTCRDWGSKRNSG